MGNKNRFIIIIILLLFPFNLFAGGAGEEDRLDIAERLISEQRYDEAQKMIKDNDLPTAVFVSGDWMALGAIKAFKENGIEVPKDISVIGYDNMAFLEYSSPALTTISQNRRQIGITAANHLLKQIDGEEVESVKIDVEVVERDTCRKLK